MEAASRRKDHASVKKLFDPRLAQQAATGVAVGMHIYMFKAHAALGEGLQAVALMKDMRAVGLPVPAPACSLLVLAFCKADALQDALLHLQCTVPPERVDTFTVNGILIAATRSKQPQLLVMHQCLDILQERGLAWNATTWRQVFRLQAGRPGSVHVQRRALFCKGSMLVSLFLLTQPRNMLVIVVLSTKQWNMQAKGNDLDGIERLKAELDTSSFKNNPEVLTAYVRALCDCNQLETASHADKLRLIREACHVVMTLAERQGRPEMLLPVLEGMQQAGVESDTAIQNSVMRLAKQQGQSPAQLEQYLIRLHQLGLRPEEQTYNILLRAYAEHGDLKAAAEILDRMGADGLLPGRYTFNALLQAHSAAGDAQGAADVYDTMKDHGIKADHCTFIALFMAIKNQSDAARSQANSGVAGWLDKHQRHAHRESSSHLLHEWVADMKAAGLKHISPSLTALVQAYGHTMDFTRMIHLLRASWNAPNSAKPNLLTYNAAISVCSRVGQLGRAIRLLHEMRAAGIAPDVRTYTSLISSCGFSRDPRMAMQLWSEMHKQGIKPTEWTYTAKAKVESSVGAFDDALRTTQQMQANGITPSKGTWQVIVSMAEQMGRPDVIRQVQSQAKISTSAYAPAAAQHSGTAAVSAAASPQGHASGFDLEDANAVATTNAFVSKSRQLLIQWWKSFSSHGDGCASLVREQGSGHCRETLCLDPSGGSQLLSDKEKLAQGGPVRKQ
ncbi:hypothetical protein WJX79_004020 [Trebouxia sp. C0005]